MSVFEIPELAHLIASYLNPYDLNRCVRVNKTWHTRYIPFLWHAVPPTSSDDVDEPKDLDLVALRLYMSWNAFRRIVIEDYQYSLRHRDDGGTGGERGGGGGGGEGVLPTLSRYGHWIRKLNISQADISRFIPEITQNKFNNNTSNGSSSNNSSTSSYDDPFAGFGLSRLGAAFSMSGSALSQ